MDAERPREERFLGTFLRHEDDLKGYARALLPSWEAVDEVMQEASLVMWRKLDQLRDESEFLPWAKVIVRFEALKARRTVARDRLCFSQEVLELLATEEEAPAGDDLALERDALEQCLAKLDDAQRDLVLLPYRGHGAIAGLAGQSNRSVNSLYKKIRRLRERLGQCVGDHLSETNPTWKPS